MHVMPMFGGHGANVNRYPAWEQAVIRNDTNRYVELLNRPDWDSDRIGEGDQVFLNPGEPGFRNHLVRFLGRRSAELAGQASGGAEQRPDPVRIDLTEPVPAHLRAIAE